MLACARSICPDVVVRLPGCFAEEVRRVGDPKIELAGADGHAVVGHRSALGTDLGVQVPGFVWPCRGVIRPPSVVAMLCSGRSNCKGGFLVGGMQLNRVAPILAMGLLA